MGSTKISQPAPPPAPSTADAIREFANVQPLLFEQQLEFAPREAQQQLELLQQFAEPLGRAQLEAQEALMPGTTALQEQLVAQANQMINDPISDEEKAQILSDINANVGTNVRSGIGDVFKARGFADLRQQRRREGQNLALTLSGRQPLAQPAAPSFTNMLGGLSPSDVLGFKSNTFNTQGGIFGAQMDAYGQQAGSGLSGAGALLQGVGALGSVGLMI